MKKVLHIITGLNDGGAEGALFRLIQHTKYDIEHTVVSLTGAGKYKALLEAEGIKVECLELGKFNCIARLCRLVRIVRNLQADVVQTWLYHADLLGGAACWFSNQKNLYWGLRQADFDIKTMKFSMRLVMKACTFVSNIFPKAHITCASTAVHSHQKIGYKGNFVVIRNGYDLCKLSPQPINREKFLGSQIDGTEIIFGMVARYDPAKDHSNLLKAFASFIGKSSKNCKLLLVGKGCDNENDALVAKILELKMHQHVILLGQSNNIPEVMSCLDCHVLSSEYEGFPNVIAEAMACGVPCISTSVGDAGIIIGEDGWLVPAKNHELLAQAMMEVSHLFSDKTYWDKLKLRCRQRIQDKFSLDAMAANFIDIWFK